jgi:Branched-chain amino acid transport protein (AzlD)
MIWAIIAALCVATVALKASGPLALGAREPTERALRVISLVAPAVLAGLVVYESLIGHGGGVAFDERLVGLATAGLAIALRAPMAVVIVLAAAATAGTRVLL